MLKNYRVKIPNLNKYETTYKKNLNCIKTSFYYELLFKSLEVNKEKIDFSVKNE